MATMATATRLDIDTPHGRADTYLFTPEHAPASGSPAALFFPDAGGVREAMRAMASRLADAGYAVLLPNVYHRAGPFEPFDTRTVFGDPSERARLGKLMDSFTAAELMEDVAAYLDALGARPEVDGERVRCVGYCMGGRHAFIAAGTFGARVAAAASIHGGGLATGKPDSPELAAPRVAAELYFAVADQDRTCTPEHQATLRAALDAAGVRYRMELYPGAAHGFAVPDFPVYDEAAAERHWAQVLELFARHR